MKILFWLATIILLIAEFFSINAFINVYFKNYNGGPQSSSGSIIYYPIIGLALIAGGLIFYFNDKLKIATAIVCLPIVLVVLYLFIMLILPFIMGERMN